MRRNNFVMCNTMHAQKLPCQGGILRSNAQSSLFMSHVIAGQVPEISTGAYINPVLWDSHNQAAISISQVLLKYDDVIIIIIFFTLSFSSSSILCQDVITGNAECSITILYQQWYIGGTLKDYLQIRHTTHACKILSRIIAVHFHATFSEKCQGC